MFCLCCTVFSRVWINFHHLKIRYYTAIEIISSSWKNCQIWVTMGLCPTRIRLEEAEYWLLPIPDLFGQASPSSSTPFPPARLTYPGHLPGSSRILHFLHFQPLCPFLILFLLRFFHLGKLNTQKAKLSDNRFYCIRNFKFVH